jgi:hypothetical protein
MDTSEYDNLSEPAGDAMDCPCGVKVSILLFPSVMCAVNRVHRRHSPTLSDAIIVINGIILGQSSDVFRLPLSHQASIL